MVNKPNLLTEFPDIAKEWDYEKNIDLKPEMLTPRNGRKVWWKCEKGHSYEAKVNDRTRKPRGTGCPYCAGKKVLIGYNDLVTKYPEIAKEWDYDKNVDLKPEMFTSGSGMKVWWICDKGHSYDSTISNRTNGQGCRYCLSKQVIKGFNDLATTHPEIAKEWDYHKNKSITPQKIKKGSDKKVWWICDKGHSYEEIVANRTKGYGCPKCNKNRTSKNINIITTTFPEIAKEWDYEKNNNLKPEMFTSGSDMKVWWICDKGHSYETKIKNRTQGSGCPICLGRKILVGYNDLGTTHPEIAKEWDYHKNKTMTPQKITKGNKTKFWWLCEKGHSYDATIKSKLEGHSCPYCSGRKAITGYNDLATTHPKIAKEWDYQKNKSLIPQKVTRGSGTKVWWICKKGHSYESRITNRTRGDGCPFCAGKKIMIGYNDLGTTCPDITKEWDYEKNKDLKPEMFTQGSKKKVWWICEKGHSYEARISYRTKSHGCPVCDKTCNRIDEKNLATTYPEIIKEWDYEKNKDLKPEMFTFGSGMKIWWLCKNGHSYETSIEKRTNGQGCPICKGKKIKIGYNDLATTNPEIAKEWDFEKNKTLTPQQVSKGSNKKVWWVCEKGHSYESKVGDRTKGCGCPFCSGHKVLKGFNDLATTHPEITKEWDYDKNIPLMPQNVMGGSHIKVWWVCEKGHSFEAQIANRIWGTKCPICSGQKKLIGYNDLATTHPEIAKEWDYEKNKGLTPQKVSKSSKNKVWWICEKGHSFEATIGHRTSGKGCPFCTGQKVLIGYNDLVSTSPELAKEWDYEKNGKLKPEMITAGSNKKVWWLCEKGHSFDATINHRNAGRGCPYCNASTSEKIITKALNDLNLEYEMFITFDELTGIGGGKLSYDFGIYKNDKLLFLIEYQGKQHYFEIKVFGGEKQLEKQKFHDDLKREYAEKYLNVPLLEIDFDIKKYDEIFNLIKDFYNIITNKNA